MKLFFDTETTGKCDFKSGPDSPRQPHIVQPAALLVENDGTERASLNLIIKPEGWTIPKEASDIHGITDEIAQRCGIPLASALSVFSMLCVQSDTIVAHNIDFDYLVASAAYHRQGKPHRMDRPTFCTMKAATPLCKLPGPYGFKWPKLSEAHEFFLNESLENSHDALADVRGCKRVFFAMQSLSNNSK